MIFSQPSLIPIIIVGFALAGCASPIPDLIKQPPPDEIRVEEAQHQPDTFIGSQVRWGGNILQVENLEDRTLIEVLSRRLFTDGKPDANSSSQGRFLIALPGFVEPAGFPKDRLITVRGRFTELSMGKVGSYRYAYPLVEPDGYYLWPEERQYRYRYVHDPFYYPWHPYPYWWYRHPYYWY
jgi:outer membrane lipoprotein